MFTQNGRFRDHPELTVISINIKGLSSSKELLLTELCVDWKCGVPKINGMQKTLELPYKKYESVIFQKPYLVIKAVGSSQINNIDIITIKLTDCLITSVYKPPTQPYEFVTIFFLNCIRSLLCVPGHGVSLDHSYSPGISSRCHQLRGNYLFIYLLIYFNSVRVAQQNTYPLDFCTAFSIICWHNMLLIYIRNKHTSVLIMYIHKHFYNKLSNIKDRSM